jgi:hypothetical protein
MARTTSIPPRSNRLTKLLVIAGAAVVLGFLMLRSVRDSRAIPYTIEPDNLRHWTLALRAAVDPSDPLLVLEPPPELASRLFDQVFRRNMESLSASSAPGIPLLLDGELRAFGGRLTADQVLAAAQNAGLASAPISPRCLAYRRLSERRGVQQLYFVLFDAPAVGRFREQLAARLAGGGGFDPAALSPVLLIAVAQSTFSRWLPLRADPKTDCVAPIVIAPRG